MLPVLETEYSEVSLLKNNSIEINDFWREQNWIKCHDIQTK
jgi:hypothetical protein